MELYKLAHVLVKALEDERISAKTKIYLYSDAEGNNVNQLDHIEELPEGGIVLVPCHDNEEPEEL